MNKPDLFDVVELQSDLPEMGLKRGMQGTVVECYPDEEYEIEFVDDEGQTFALCALPLDKIFLNYKARTQQKRQVIQQLSSIIHELDEERTQKVLDFADSLRQRQSA